MRATIVVVRNLWEDARIRILGDDDGDKSGRFEPVGSTPNASFDHPVLLVFHWPGDPRLSVESLPPLGLLHIAANLERHGIPVEVVDRTVMPGAEISAKRHDVIGFSVNISNREVTLREIARLKRERPDLRIVVGGPLCLCRPEMFTDNPDIDAVFACEGEEALVEYLLAPDPTQVRGLYVRLGNEVVFTGERPWIEDLDSLPFPAFQKVPVRRYNNFPKRARPVVSLMTSRGCPFRCIFCSNAMGRKWRAHSPERVVSDIHRLVRDFGVREVCIYDDNFGMDRERALAICERIVTQGIRVHLQFSNGLRIDRLDHEVLAALRRAGTWFLGIAPETGSPAVMRRIRKGFRLDRVRAVREECRRLGIVTHGFFMVGFPFETRADIAETVRFARELDCEIVEFNKVIPYPRTELYDNLKSRGALMADPCVVAQSYHEGTVVTHRVGDLEPEEVKALIRRAYRSYYLRPRKMWDLLRAFGWRDVAHLALYALRTGNI